MKILEVMMIVGSDHTSGVHVFAIISCNCINHDSIIATDSHIINIQVHEFQGIIVITLVLKFEICLQVILVKGSP